MCEVRPILLVLDVLFLPAASFSFVHRDMPVALMSILLPLFSLVALLIEMPLFQLCFRAVDVLGFVIPLVVLFPVVVFSMAVSGIYDVDKIIKLNMCSCSFSVSFNHPLLPAAPLEIACHLSYRFSPVGSVFPGADAFSAPCHIMCVDTLPLFSNPGSMPVSS